MTPEAPVTIHPREVIDLTLPLRAGMPVYPGDPPVTSQRVSEADPSSESCAVTAVSFGTHAGTHLDAPAHVIPGGAGVDTIPLDACIGPACIVDCTRLPSITQPELQRRAGNLEPGTRVLIRTDWDRAWATPDYYTRFPGLTLPAVRWLVEQGARLLGLETPSVCRTRDHTAHVLLLQAGVVVVEGLAGLRQVPAPRCHFAALPLRLEGLDGSPVRAVAWVP